VAPSEIAACQLISQLGEEAVLLWLLPTIGLPELRFNH
jgi:hypothetical protein